MFSDIELSRSFESAEAFACLEFARARARIFPESGSAWIQCVGATVVFDGIDSPTTQAFGLGIHEPATPEALDTIEQFFFDRKTATMLEVSPLAGVPTLDLLCARGYRPIEISNVLYRSVEVPTEPLPPGIRVREIEPAEAALWSSISARGWTFEHPELENFVQSAGALIAARANSPCFLAEVDGTPAAAGALTLHQGVALFGGAATLPEFRRRGLQSALLHERMRYAHQHGCNLAMMVAEAGSGSQHNAERKGFRVAYTRLKWKLDPPAK